MSELQEAGEPSEICSPLIEALVEPRTAPESSSALARLNSVMTDGPRSSLMGVANLKIAQLYAVRGDTTRALAAVKRRPYNDAVMAYIPAYLALEGKLSLAVGDSTRAREAFEHYLRLRTDPEPPLQPEKEEIETLLASLGGG